MTELADIIRVKNTQDDWDDPHKDTIGSRMRASEKATHLRHDDEELDRMFRSFRAMRKLNDDAFYDPYPWMLLARDVVGIVIVLSILIAITMYSYDAYVLCGDC